MHFIRIIALCLIIYKYFDYNFINVIIIVLQKIERYICLIYNLLASLVGIAIAISIHEFGHAYSAHLLVMIRLNIMAE